MRTGLEGRIDGERPEQIKDLLDSTASLWEEVAQRESSNIFVPMGFEDYDTDKDRDYVSFNSEKLKRQYGFIGSSDIHEMLVHYQKDLKTELDRIIFPDLFNEAFRLHKILEFQEVKTALDEFVYMD